MAEVDFIAFLANLGEFTLRQLCRLIKNYLLQHKKTGLIHISLKKIHLKKII